MARKIAAFRMDLALDKVHLFPISLHLPFICVILNGPCVAFYKNEKLMTKS